MAIVVSHLPPGRDGAAAFDALARQALRQQALADLIELRLDPLGHPGTEALRAFCRAAEKPVIVACPGPEDGGAFAGSVDERCQLFRDAAAAGARFVDVPWWLSLELGELEHKCHRIVSRHDLDGVPDDPEAFHEEVAAVLYEGDVTKLVATATSTEEALRWLRFLATTRGVVGHCMGAKGGFTRVLAAIFGSPFTYAAPARMTGEPAPGPSAPGQIPVDELLGWMPPGGANQETAIFAVVGRHVARSASPRVHGMAFKALRLNAVYVALEVESLERCLALCDAPSWRGFSVTAPFKGAALELAGRADGGAQAAGAANTLVREKDGWRAANTDVPAVRETLLRAYELHARRAAGASATPATPATIGEASALVLGTGGAARSAGHALKTLGARLAFAGRDARRTAEIARAFGAESVAWDAVGAQAYDVLVHATPLGSGLDDATRGALPIAADALRRGALVLDAVYRPIRTPLCVAAAARGCTVVPGAEWFVRQAAGQVKLFTGADPDEALLRATFEHDLAAGG
jgi:3-dehydroquinate dehydratase/shikimate dehydrogenase